MVLGSVGMVSATIVTAYPPFSWSFTAVVRPTTPKWYNRTLVQCDQPECGIHGTCRPLIQLLALPCLCWTWVVLWSSMKYRILAPRVEECGGFEVKCYLDVHSSALGFCRVISAVLRQFSCSQVCLACLGELSTTTDWSSPTCHNTARVIKCRTSGTYSDRQY